MDVESLSSIMYAKEARHFIGWIIHAQGRNPGFALPPEGAE
jgi:hypothetical protein